MQRYGVRDVERLLRLPRSTIRAFVDAGFVQPDRGPRNALSFSFQDLIVLRTAQALAAAKIPARRITRSVRELRRHLPKTMPLAGLSIGAVADHVVVREGGRRWQADSGQYLLGFDADPDGGALRVLERAAPHPAAAPAAPPIATDSDWYGQAVALESDDHQAALAAYREAIAADPHLVEARINLGRLLHELGQLARAERVYREALQACGHDAVLLFNLGVLLEDLRRGPEAVEAYQAALRAEPGMADCHYNLALLCEQLRRPREAIRHMAQYRKLVGGRTT